MLDLIKGILFYVYMVVDFKELAIFIHLILLFIMFFFFPMVMMVGILIFSPILILRVICGLPKLVKDATMHINFMLGLIHSLPYFEVASYFNNMLLMHGLLLSKVLLNGLNITRRNLGQMFTKVLGILPLEIEMII